MMQLAFEFAAAAVMAAAPMAAIVVETPPPVIAPRAASAKPQAGSCCRFIARAIDEHVRSYRGAKVPATTQRKRLLAGECADWEAEAIIYAAASFRREYVQRSRRRIRRELLWNHEKIEI